MTTRPDNSPRPDRDPDWEALARHLSGEGEGGELAPEDRALLAELSRAADRAPRIAVERLDVEGALARVRSRRGETPVTPLRSRQPERSPWASPMVRLAAGVGIALLGAYLWQGRQGQGPASMASQTHVAPRGAPDSLTLADGSQVILAPGSRLVIPAGFGAGTRRLELEGDGWFKVEHDGGTEGRNDGGAQPFIVVSGGTEVRDIGTIFEVNTFGAAGLRVAVEQGSVAVKSAVSAEVLLVVGQEALVDASGVATVRPSPGAQGWASGELRFRDVTLEELGETLDRWYGIRLQVDDALRGKRVTTGLNASSVKGVVQELGLTMDAEVEWVGDTAIVRRRGGNR